MIYLYVFAAVAVVVLVIIGLRSARSQTHLVERAGDVLEDAVPTFVREAASAAMPDAQIEDADLDVCGDLCLTLSREGTHHLLKVFCQDEIVFSVVRSRIFDFPGTGTYELASQASRVEGPVSERSDATARFIESAIDENMAGRGFTSTPEDESASLLVGYYAAFESVPAARSIEDAFGYAEEETAWTTEAVEELLSKDRVRGVLVIDVVDAASNSPVWRAVAQARVDPNAPLSVREDRISRAVYAMLGQFPPQRARGPREIIAG